MNIIRHFERRSVSNFVGKLRSGLIDNPLTCKNRSIINSKIVYSFQTFSIAKLIVYNIYTINIHLIYGPEFECAQNNSFDQDRKACMDCLEGQCDTEHQSCDVEQIVQTTLAAFPKK